MFQEIGILLKENWIIFLQGLGYTLILAIVGTFIGLLLGILFGIIKNYQINPNENRILKCLKYFLKGIVTVYVTIFRGTPMMVQAMIIYFGGRLIGMWSSTSINSFLVDGHLFCGLVVISLNTAAYMAEIIRAGINSVDKGQMEASRSLGLNYFQSMRLVIIPQALKNSIPTIGNEFIVNIKDSSVLNVISVTELYMAVSIATSTNYYRVAGYVIIAIIYLLLTLIASFILKRIEKHLDKNTINSANEMKIKVVTYDD